jgi:hypothetical protein
MYLNQDFEEIKKNWQKEKKTKKNNGDVKIYSTED